MTAFTAGPRAASASSPKCRTATGRPRPSSPHCAAIELKRRVSSTAPSTASGFSPTSSSSWSPPSSPTTSSSSTIWDRTKEKPCETPSKPPAPVSSSFPNTRRSQPHRAALRQAQRLRPKGCAPHARRRVRRHRSSPNRRPPRRMRKLSHRRRLCVSLNADGSNGSRAAGTSGCRRFPGGCVPRVLVLAA